MRTHYFRGHTEKKGEMGKEERGGGGGREEFGKGVGRGGGGGRSRDRGRKERGSGRKRKEGRGEEISLTAAKQSHLPDSSHAQWEPAEANFWSHSWHSYKTNTDAGQQTAWDN